MEFVYVFIGSDGECEVNYSLDSLRENQNHTEQYHGSEK